MPLSPPADREEIHLRNIELRGFRRQSEGLWDIEARLSDSKTYPFKNRYRESGFIKPGEFLHDMWMRITCDNRFVVVDIEAVTDASPFPVCPNIVAAYKQLIGKRMTKGWSKAVKEAVGGVDGCTHLTALLIPMATVALQTMGSILSREIPELDNFKPGHLDTCHALKSDGEVVKRVYPKWYEGD